jgi:hypothetical protein
MCWRDLRQRELSQALARRQNRARHLRVLTRWRAGNAPVLVCAPHRTRRSAFTLHERFIARPNPSRFTFMLHRPERPAAGTLDDAPEQNNQARATPEESRLDAFGTVAQPPGDQGGIRGGVRATAIAPTNLDMASLTHRDLAVIRHLVLLRVLTYDQIHRLAFAPADPSITRRRIRHLARAGWLSTWEAPSVRGGHARYAHPSARAIRVVLPELTPDAPWAPLIRRMVPRSHRRPLTLGGNAPKWLAHQREVNHLVTSMVASPARRILWVSSWDCPFPSRVSMFTMPQPDYVLVEEVDGAPRLIFGEHDRGHEPIDRFIARKIALYSALAEFPEVCEQQFGIATFRVDVTVIDPVRRAPIARLRLLLDAARSSMQPAVFQFTLGGWLHAYPDASVWFDVAHAPATDSAAWRDHTNPVAPW